MTTARTQSRALDGWRILLLRPPSRGDTMAAVLRDHGARPVHAPLITTITLTGSPRLRAAVADLAGGRYDWLAVTSPAGADALRDTAAGMGVPLAVAPHTRVAAVGPATAAALSQVGVHVDLLPGAPGSAATLAAAWPLEEPGGTVLLPRSSRAGPTLPDALISRGYVVEDVVAYRTETHPLPAEHATALLRGDIAAVVFTSGSTVRAFADSFPDGGQRRSIRAHCIAIGQPSAKTLTELGMPVAAVAPTPTPGGIVDALTSLRHPDTHPIDDAGSTS